ncbi:histone-lysine N-methyltransferase SETMAR [Trichonephila clavipes]|uniref:Histone-lysine N-methyltransferase SETMAR n=1 Tax=Trichonephila clavipes TaxID=2585209 RepID=A0A8X6V401_TRICX|nr:histone-lysine N-methyltransferase SETMAR [Trichonephila clavipes]
MLDRVVAVLAQSGDQPLSLVPVGKMITKQMIWRWCHQFCNGRQQVRDKPRHGRPRTAITDEKVIKVDDMIKTNWRITINEVVGEHGMGHQRSHKVVNDFLEYNKVSTR